MLLLKKESLIMPNPENPHFQEARTLLERFPWKIEEDLKEFQLRQITNGHLHETWFLEVLGQPKYVLQRLNPIFDLEAVNNNLIQLEKVQTDSHDLPSHWRKVKYFSVLNSSDKIYYDETGVAWRLMEYLPGQVFNSFNQVSKEKKAEIAFVLGETIADFDHVLSGIPLELVKSPLPRYHDTSYHFDYLLSILNRLTVPLSLSQKSFPEVSIDKKFFSEYAQRINLLWQDIFVNKNLINCLDGLGKAVMHNDFVLKNMIVFQVDGKFHGTPIDLDTIQLGEEGSVLNDLCDALRFAGNPAGEEPKKIDQVFIDKEIVESIISGFINTYKKFHGENETRKLVTMIFPAYQKFHYEQAMRFFADALIGNQYYRLKTNQPKDLNLYRAEVQMRALKEIQRVYRV